MNAKSLSMKSQQVLILRHSKGTPPGSTLEWLRKSEIPFVIHHYEETPHLQPQIEKYSGLVICGGGMNVDEEHLFPWMTGEKKLIASALKHNLPTIGLCLGAQLIAEVLGAKVGKHKCTEAGWHNIEIDREVHPLLHFSENKLRAFQWHSYCFETPKSALRFARNDITENQGFIYNQNVVATQFHPESTKEWILECLQSKDYPIGPFCQRPALALSELNENQFLLQKWYFELLEHVFQFST